MVQEEVDSQRSLSEIKVLVIAARENAIALADNVANLLGKGVEQVQTYTEVKESALDGVDVVLGEIRILEAFEDIKSIRNLRAKRPMLPVVALSDNDDPALLAEAYAVGVVTCLSTKISAANLVMHLRGLHRLSASARLVEVQNSEIIDTLRDLRKANENLKREVQERKIAEEERAKALEQSYASAKLASLGEMAGSIAHEIKTPLAVVSGSLSIIKDSLASLDGGAKELMDNVTDVESMMDRINAIVRGLKSYSRPDELDPLELVSVKEIIDDTISLCQDSIAQSDVELIVDEIPEGVSIQCRPTQISQILINLINNAKYEVERDSSGWIKVSCQTTGTHTEISVIDSGQGVPAEVADKLFKAFYTTKPKGVGTGLGLNICQKIAESHGGRLFLDRDHSNTRFVLQLEKAESHRQAS